MELSITEKQKT